MQANITWGVSEGGRSLVRHAYPARTPLWRRSFKPQALCGLAWSPTPDPVDDPGRRPCRTCERIAKLGTPQMPRGL